MNSVQDIMTTDVQTCSLNDNVDEVARKMRDYNIGIIPITDSSQQCVGIITDRDIVIRGVAENQDGSAQVEDVMSNDLVVGTPSMSIDQAAQVMAERQIRRLPVVDQQKLLGVVALGDLAVRRDLANEAGQALSEISSPTRQLQQ